jgi:hypothetical protein
MAVVWIDPYINSPNGGIHGTINGTTQDGSYSYPFPLSTSPSTGSASKTALGLSSGDEVRIKGLPVDTFWGASVPFTSVTISGGNAAYIQAYTVNAAHTNKFCRVKTIQSQRLLYLHAYSGYFQTSFYSGAWVTQVSYLDQTFGSQLFDLNYALGNNTCYLCTNGFSVGDNITLTAGWTSETVQGGETILTGATKTLYAYIGQSSFNTDDLGNPLTINAPELSILGNTPGHLYGNDITLRSLSGHEAANAPPEISATGNVTIQQYTCSWSTASLRLFNYQSGGPAQSVLDVDYISPQFYGNIISFATDKDTSVSRWKFKIKEFHSGYGPLIDLSTGIPAGHTLDFEVKANYLLATKDSRVGFSDVTKLGTYTITGSGLTNEMAWNPTTYVGEFIFAGKSATAAANRSVLIPYTGSNPEIGTSPFIQTNFGAYSRTVFLAQLLNGTTSIETIDSPIGTISASTSYGSPAKATILADEQGDKPCQLMFSSNSTTTAYPVIVFRSASFANKVTWHFTSYTDAGIYADTFAIDLPDFSSSDLTFTAAFTTSSTPGVTIKAQLYTVNASGVTSAYGLQTASVVGTAATISQVVTSATLTANAAKSAYVIVEMTKTSSAVANISINTIGLA